jgi:hypothetical protein
LHRVACSRLGRPCFYCGSASEQPVYAIPRWLPPLLGLHDASVEHLVAGPPASRDVADPAEQVPTSLPRHFALGDRQPDTRLGEGIESAIASRSRLSVEQYSATTLCRGCASAVHELDERAVPLVEPMVEGEARAYDATEQRLLAGWGARTAYAVLSVERKGQGVPRSHRRVLREREEPHENVFVGFGRYRGSDIGVLAGRLVVSLGKPDATPEVEAYTVAAVFGHLVLKVFGIRRRPAGTATRSPQGELVRFWPAHFERATWPPLWSVTEQTLEHVFKQVPFYRPFDYSEVRYLSPGEKTRVRRKRTEGLRGRQ